MIDVYVALGDLIAGVMGIWVFQLVRRDRLYVGYGVIFVVAIGTAMIPLTFPRVLEPLVGLSRLSERSLALISLVLLFVVIMLIYVMSQLTLLSNRVTSLTQELAIRGALSNEKAALRDDAREG